MHTPSYSPVKFFEKQNAEFKLCVLCFNTDAYRALSLPLLALP